MLNGAEWVCRNRVTMLKRTKEIIGHSGSEQLSDKVLIGYRDSKRHVYVCWFFKQPANLLAVKLEASL